MLAKAGLDEEALRCGPHPPFAEAEARALVERRERPKRIHNNCSGKHAGMLALAVRMGWDPDDYHHIEHPVQRRMLEEVAGWADVSGNDIGVAVDGCGVACFSVPLRDMAASLARFSRSRATSLSTANSEFGCGPAVPWPPCLCVSSSSRLGSHGFQQ